MPQPDIVYTLMQNVIYNVTAGGVNPVQHYASQVLQSLQYVSCLYRW